jgi:hypothetical protein
VMQPDWESRGYELVGRIIVEWGELDQQITRAIWKDNDPHAAFPVGPVPHSFYKRWLRWCKISEPHCHPKNRAAFHQFRTEVTELSERRDNLAHNVASVTAKQADVCVYIDCLAPADWRDRFDFYAAKIAKLPMALRLRQRLPTALRAISHPLYERDLLMTLQDVQGASARIRSIADTIAHGGKF